MPSRRAFLGLAAGTVAVGVPLLAAARAFAADGLPLTVVNNSGRFPNSAIRLYIVGTELSTGRQGYVRTSGQFTPASLADNGPDGYADLSVKLGEGTTTINLPRMSGRVYVAINDPLKFKVVGTGSGVGLQYPAAWVESDASYKVLHDCMEFTYSDAGMFCNTTMVDMFSVPLAITLKGSRTQTTGALVNGGRDRIFAAIKALPDFRNLVVGDNLRVIAPGHGLAAGRFANTYFDTYIDQVWRKYAGTDLRIKTATGDFTGRVSGNRLVFDRRCAPFGKPSTKDVLFCDGALVSPNDGVTGPVGAMLGAGFNRATLLNNAQQPVTSTSGYYTGAVANHYARVFHENTVDGKAYGFAYDDVLDHASYIQDNKPSAITLTITPFGAGNPNPGPSTGPTTPAPQPSAPQPPPAGGPYPPIAVATAAAASRRTGRMRNGDWLEFRKVAFGGDGACGFEVRAASGAAAGVSGLVEVRLDSRSSKPVGSIAVGTTGGWQAFKSVRGVLSRITGTRTVFLTFTSGQPADFVAVESLTFTR